MKKVMWIVAMIPVVVTSVVLQFMPDIIPMHHDLEGNTDRWGSKTESFIFPVIILFITLFWQKMQIQKRNRWRQNLLQRYYVL